MIKSVKSFTLIELLIVIVIIGILAASLIYKINGIQWRSRDIQRMTDLKQMQTALELYYAENNNYPETFSKFINWYLWWYDCGYYDNADGDYIPGLVPNYITMLPSDPKGNKPIMCYMYKSDWSDYMIMAVQTAEWKVPTEFQRPLAPEQNSFAVYTSWARMW